MQIFDVSLLVLWVSLFLFLVNILIFHDQTKVDTFLDTLYVFFTSIGFLAPYFCLLKPPLSCGAKIFISFS